MPDDLDKGGNPLPSFDLIARGPTLGWVKQYGESSGGGGDGSTDDYWVNARDFSATPESFGQGFTDDGPAIQAAIDYAFANGKTAVRIPDGSYCAIKETLWLDPPSNMRGAPGNVANPPQFQFTMALIGGETLSNDLYRGITIEAYADDGNGNIDWSTNGNYPVIVIGTGQGMRCVGINVRLPGGSLWANSFGAETIGFAISGGSGGASRTMIERCSAFRMRSGFKTGWNNGSLADSNTFIKCWAQACVYGFHFAETQNYINELISCQAGGCPFAVFSPVGKAVQIYGGNFSYAGASLADFAIGSTTGLSSVTTSAGTYLGKFSTTITYAGEFFGFAENGFTDGEGTQPFDCFGLETDKFGIVPCQFVSYDAGTNTVTLEFVPNWVYSQFGISPDFTTTDLEAEIQACTSLLTAQRFTAFSGAGIHVYGAHTENPDTVLCLLNNATGSDGDRLASIENMYFNYSPTQNAGTVGNKLMSVWPLVQSDSSGGIRLRGGTYNTAQSNRPYLFSSVNASRIVVEDTGIIHPNVWLIHNANIIDNTTTSYASRARGVGEWGPVTPFAPISNAGWFSSDGAGVGWVQNGRGRYRALGYMPEPGRDLELTPALYALVAASPIVSVMLEYPIILGQQTYRVADWDTGTTDGNLFVVSDHELFSYGQDLTLNWEYKGQSNCVYFDDLGLMFQGLKIGLDNGGGTEWYVVTGVYPSGNVANPRPGYVTVVGAVNSPLTLLAGTKTVTYTGSTVSQEAYSFAEYGGSITQPLVTLTDAATIAVDLSLGINFEVTLAGNRTLGNPTNPVVGQKGIIRVTQDGSGSRTLAYGGNYKFIGGIAPTLTTTAAAVDYLEYWVETATRIWIRADLDVK